MKNNSYDAKWVLALFGTAVGAGILFLPIRAGMAGFWPIIVMIILIFPMTWLSHRNLSRFVTSSDKDNNIIEASEDYFGNLVSKIIVFLYFFAIFPICLAYGVGITNTIASFLSNQLHIVGIPRFWIAFISISIMMLIMNSNQEMIMKCVQLMVYPLITVLFLFSIYLIPKWNLSSLYVPTTSYNFLLTIWLTLPVLVFAFNHSPAISSFSLELKKVYGAKAEQKASTILLFTTIILTIFIMFFVISIVLTLTGDQMLEARKQNIPILSYIANIEGSSFISFLVPFVAFFAIVSSFFGHYLGAHEGLVGIVKKYSKSGVENEKRIKIFSSIFIYISMIFIAVINPNILDMVETLGGPIIAVILFLMPIYAIYKVPRMRKYANSINDIFIVVTALFTIISIIYKLL